MIDSQSRSWVRALLLLVAPLFLSATLSAPGVPLQVGYGAFTPDDGSLPPAMTALFRLENPEGILVSEAGVGAGRTMMTGKIFVQQDDQRSTAVALANHSDSPLQVSFFLFDEDGQTIGQSGLTLAAREQRARFVNEMFQGVPSPFVGTMTLEADASSPVLGAVTIRQGTNSFGEPTFATLPVADLSLLTVLNNTTAESLIFPQVGAGGGISTQIVLFTKGSQAVQGTIAMTSSNGSLLELQLKGTVASEFPFQIPAGGVFFAELTNPDPEAVGVGYAVVTVEQGNELPVGSAIFRFVDGAGNAISEAGVGAASPTGRLRVFLDNLGTRIGVAVANPQAQLNGIDFDLLDAGGKVIAGAQRDLPANGHSAFFADELFTLEDDFLGSMEIRSQLPVAAVTLKLTTNQRGQPIITSLPVADLDNPIIGSTRIVAQMGLGGSPAGDFSTRLISISTDPNGVTSGRLAFWTGPGQPWAPAQAPSSFDYDLGSGEIGDIPFDGSPAPLVIERGNSASALITKDGGTIRVENDGGDVITLRIPPYGLLDSETITVTALTSRPKRFFAKNLVPGILLEPDGLVLNLPARLEIQLATPPDRPELAGISWLANQTLALPVGDQSVEDGTIEAEIQHFSTYSADEVTLEEATASAWRIAGGSRGDTGVLDLDDALATLLVDIDVAKAVLKHEAYRQAAGGESSDLVDTALGAVEQAVLQFLNSAVPSDPCGLYHGLLPKLTTFVESVGDPDLTALYRQRIASVDEDCIGEVLAGNWLIESFDASQTCRLVSNCSSGCTWEEDEEDDEVLATVGQEGSAFTFSFPAFPDVGTLSGQVQATGNPIEPYFFTVSIASVSTFDCKTFFETQGLGIDFGAPICNSGSTCIPNACFESEGLFGNVNADGTSALGIEQWDFSATVTETPNNGSPRVIRYECRGASSFVATKQEEE